jgi:hypothetical protein
MHEKTPQPHPSPAASRPRPAGSAGAPPVIRRAPFKGWEAVWIERGPLTLILVPQVGGRIMSFFWHGRELAFVNPAYQGRVDDVASIADLHDYKRRAGFLLWGGEKTWLAPQDRWSDDVPFVDLDSGAYELALDRTTGAATMTSPVCRETGVQIERRLELGPQVGTWGVTHTLRNRSDRVVTWAPWSVDMVLRPATVYLPTRSGSPYPRGVRTFGNEGVSAAVRDQVVSFLDDIAVISCRRPVRFKYGTDADPGRLLAVLEAGGGLVGYRKSVPVYHDRSYGNGCVLEVFNAPALPYLELELHGPLASLQPGESFSVRTDAALFELDVVPSTAAAVRERLAIA